MENGTKNLARVRIDRTTKDANLLAVLQGLIVCGGVIDVLTSDLDLWAEAGRRKPTIIYRPGTNSPDYVWLQCPEISSVEFDIAMDYFNAHWQSLMGDPVWRKWVVEHPIPDDVVAT